MWNYEYIKIISVTQWMQYDCVNVDFLVTVVVRKVCASLVKRCPRHLTVMLKLNVIFYLHILYTISYRFLIMYFTNFLFRYLGRT